MTSGQIDIRGYPHWVASRQDDMRTLKIKAAKNIISLINEWKNGGVDAYGNVSESQHMETYLRAIEVLKEEGEVYP